MTPPIAADEPITDEQLPAAQTETVAGDLPANTILPVVNDSDPAGEPPAELQPPAEEARRFRPEGPEGALRITFDDIDLLKTIQMDPVTPDCVEKMPGWLRDLNGKRVRLRGFMKPHELATGFRRFVFVRDTKLCCFGPAGKIYDLISVTLLKGTSTDYIDLRPFDVIGTFRIEVEYLEDVQEVYELYHLDDAQIVVK